MVDKQEKSLEEENTIEQDDVETVEETSTVEEQLDTEELVMEDENQDEEYELEDAGSSKIKELETKLEETTNRLLRLQADYENFRRRTRLEKEADAKYRSQRLAEELLPAIDNFERALNTQVESDETKNVLQGMDMVYRQLQDALKKEGIEAIETMGQPFDPHVHQAVMQVEEEGYDSNVVVGELQKGYKLKDRVIRPAMVKVNQ
ncbi:nucleotide exchange factor GrpE [Bacillus tamaricis]|uniref:Protein GrpE n=1 Tax=Evansella tamaricis TaxID=2069301 RepID=A0ABS6JJY7_9BACI|nr:nucleotide exchange factor GrpE [Evansella tamaricis]